MKKYKNRLITKIFVTKGEFELGAHYTITSNGFCKRQPNRDIDEVINNYPYNSGNALFVESNSSNKEVIEKALKKLKEKYNCNIVIFK